MHITEKKTFSHIFQEKEILQIVCEEIATFYII